MKLIRRYRGKISRSSRVSFSECGEDIILETILSMAKIDRFTWIDVGANHPVKANDFFRAYLNGLQGLSVDPLPELTHLYRKFRKREVFLTAAVSPEECKLYLARNAEHRLSKTTTNHLEGCEVTTVTPKQLAILIRDDLPLVIKVDIEGLDLQLAQAFINFRNLSLLIVETFEGIQGRNEDIRNFESALGNAFIKCAMTPLNSFYVATSVWPFVKLNN